MRFIRQGDNKIFEVHENETLHLPKGAYTSEGILPDNAQVIGEGYGKVRLPESKGIIQEHIGEIKKK